jgi:hypothetical protein
MKSGEKMKDKHIFFCLAALGILSATCLAVKSMESMEKVKKCQNNL